jgi:hypothetical protein
MLPRALDAARLRVPLLTHAHLQVPRRGADRWEDLVYE